MSRTIFIKDFKKLEYTKAWKVQENYFKQLLYLKREQKKHGDIIKIPNYILLYEHDHVYTIGRSAASKKHVINRDLFEKLKVPYYEVNRGGSLTYHGPGQLVIYFILDLEQFDKDINSYLRTLESIVKTYLQNKGITTETGTDLTGVWVKNKKTQELEKICSIGIRTSSWITMHGLSLNVNNELNYFDIIDPCGLKGVRATSMSKLLGKEYSLTEVSEEIKSIISKEFSEDKISL